MLYCRLERVGPAELRVDDNEADCPVDDERKSNKEQGAREQAGVFEGVGLSDDTGTAARVSRCLAGWHVLSVLSHNAVGHVHERIAHSTPWLGALEIICRVDVGGDGDAWRLDSREQRQSLHPFSPIVSTRIHVVVALELYPFFALLRIAVHAPTHRVLVEAHAVGRPRRASWPRVRKRRLTLEPTAIWSCVGMRRRCRSRS